MDTKDICIFAVVLISHLTIYNKLDPTTLYFTSFNIAFSSTSIKI